MTWRRTSSGLRWRPFRAPSVPGPYGGKQRQVVVDLDPNALYAKQLSAIDVSNAFNLQNLILPAGTIKVGDTEYAVRLNSSPEIISEMNDLPIKTVNGATVYLKDVATVRDGFAVQQNIVRTNGTRGALMTILRNGQASTLDIVNKVKAASAQNRGRHAAGVEDTAALRSVAVRARGHQRRSARKPLSPRCSPG